MRFKQFLSESTLSFEEILKSIKRDCQPFLNQSGGLPLYRGVGKSFDFSFNHHPTNRKAKDSWEEPSLNFVFNAMMELKFKESEIRKHTLFATGDDGVASDYGNTFYGFPAGDIKFLWSSVIKDSYDNFGEIVVSMEPLLRTELRKMGIPPSIGLIGTIKNIFRHLSISTDNNPHSWINGDKKQLIDAIKDTMEFNSSTEFEFNPEYVSQIDVNAINQLYMDALRETAKHLYYDSVELDEAIWSKNEILFYKTSGYYLLSTDHVRDEMIKQGVDYDTEQLTYDFLLNKISGS